ncbi:ABC transporter substrate-binding protein [Agromyces bauzanensis]
MRTRHTLPALAAAVLLLAGCATPAASGTADDASADLRTVNVGTVPLSLFAPLFIADAKGYFADEGINLNIQTVTSGQDAIPLAANGQLDVLIAGFSAGMFNALGAGLEVNVVGSMALTDGNEDDPSSALLVSSTLKSEVSGIEDLKGRKIAIAGGVGGSGAYFVAEALAREGLSLNDVTVENLGNADMPAALASGGVDAANASVPFNQTAVDDGSAFVVSVPPEGMCSTGVIYGDAFAKSELAQPFFDALARGAADVQDGAVYSDENLGILAEATGQDIETLRNTPLFIWLADLAPLTEELRTMEEVWMSVGAITYDKPLDPDSYIDSSFSNNIP